MRIFRGSWFLHNHEIPHLNQWGSMKSHKEMMSIPPKEVIFSFLIATFVMSDILFVFFVGSTKIGENSDISKCFENFVSQALGVLTRIYAAELR